MVDTAFVLDERPPMDSSLPTLISLLYFSTGRRLFVFRQLQTIASDLGFAALETHVQSAIQKDTETLLLEQRWATKRRTGKLSDKQIKAQKEVKKIDGQVDRTLSALRDAAEAQRRGADDDKDIIDKVETLIDAVLPQGVRAVSTLSFPEELVAVREILRRLDTTELSPLVTELGLTRIVNRLKKLADQYEAAQKAAGTLEYGMVRAAREQGQHRLLEAVALIVGAYHGPDGDSAKQRAALLLPVLKQNAAISAHYSRTRRAAPDVDPTTGEEQDSELDEEMPLSTPEGAENTA